ncbi:MAG: hypothetical protein H0T73_22845 [Ardenticatenales bacterium]|nr:hypothetical protein [Ardenticatenales bacterium]
MVANASDKRPLLIAADWQSRALLLAELQERGIEVRTEAGVRWTVKALMAEPLAPPLIFLDTHGDPDATPEKVERLLAILAEDNVTPALLLLVGVFEQGMWQEAPGARVTLLTRPKTVGEMARLIEEKLAERADH